MEGKYGFELPGYLNGDYWVTGPSLSTMGDRRVGHYFDSFGRNTRARIKDGKVVFSTRMIDSYWYKESKRINDFVLGLKFRDTNPPTLMNRIPFLSLYYTQYFDNNYVMPGRLPNGTYLSLTDSANQFEIDPDTLQQKS